MGRKDMGRKTISEEEKRAHKAAYQKEYFKKWYEKNKERRKAYREANKERDKETIKRWRENNNPPVGFQKQQRNLRPGD